jgi:dimethylaniline monooxygenase (N-oxide forming)
MTASFFLKIFLFALRNFPSFWNRLADSMLVKMSKKAFPTQRKEWNLLPAPSIAVVTPVVADEIFPLMESGFATPVSEIERVSGSKQVTLKDGRVLDDIDSIIYCTGYDFDVPRFVPQEFHPYPVKGKEPYLYRNIFPLHPDPDVRNSLAFLGQAAFPFPGFVQHEMYGLAVSQVWQGKSKLPPLMGMEQWHHDNIAWRNKLCKQHKVEGFYSVFTRAEDMTPWLNETAGTGLFEYTSLFSRKAWSFWWQDRKFYNLVTGGLFSPSIWRLFDMGKRKAWNGAKEQIIQDNEFAAMRAKERVEKMLKEKEVKKEK